MAAKKLLSDDALTFLKRNPTAKQALAELFNKSAWTIGAWIRSNDSRLAIEKSIAIIAEHTGLTEKEILVVMEPVAA